MHRQRLAMTIAAGLGVLATFMPRLAGLALATAVLAACHMSPEKAAAQLAAQGLESTTAGFAVAAASKDPSTIPLFLAAGVDPNSRNAQGSTPLCAAAEAGRDAYVAALLALKTVKVDEPCGSAGTAYGAAVVAGKTSTAGLLSAAGAKPLFEPSLPVRLGSPWTDSVAKLRGAGSDCSDAAQYDLVALSCAIPPVTVGGHKFTRLDLNGRASLTVNQLVLNADPIKSGCGDFLKVIPGTLGPDWTVVKQTDSSLIAAVKGDRRLRAVCAPFAMMIMIEDEWAMLPTGRKAFMGGEMPVWDLVKDVSSGMIASGKTLGRSRHQQNEVFEILMSELREAFVHARSLGQDLNERNLKALNAYQTLVFSDGWYQRLYFDAWDAHR